MKAADDFIGGEIIIRRYCTLPKGPYGESKLLAEKYILSKLLQTCNMQPATCDPQPAKKVYIIRPCMIHGPGNKGLVCFTRWFKRDYHGRWELSKINGRFQ